MPRPSRLGEKGFLYFISSVEQNAIKIGYATDTYTRLKSLQSGNPAQLDIMGYVACTFGGELALHETLKSRRIRLEWYPDDDFIGNLVLELLDEGMDRSIAWMAENRPDLDPMVAIHNAISLASEDVALTATDIRQILAAAAAREAA
jgi:hypothetical protein